MFSCLSILWHTTGETIQLLNVLCFIRKRKTNETFSQCRDGGVHEKNPTQPWIAWNISSNDVIVAHVDWLPSRCFREEHDSIFNVLTYVMIHFYCIRNTGLLTAPINFIFRDFIDGLSYWLLEVPSLLFRREPQFSRQRILCT